MRIRQIRGVWGAEPLAQSLWLKAKEIVRANGDPTIVTGFAKRASHAREASVEITGLGYGYIPPLLAPPDDDGQTSAPDT